MPISPFTLLRLDAALVDRIKREEGLADIVRTALATIVVGAGAYGAAFGLWRAPMQACFGALKLPLVLLGVAMLTAASSAVLAPLLGARLKPMQTIAAILASLAITSALLGAIAPVAICLVIAAAPRGSSTDAAVAQSLVLSHTLVIAVAGIAGVLALIRLVTGLVGSRPIARRVVVAWMATQLMTGAQLSWLLRPFLGRPDRAVTFFAPDALVGGFFDEVLRLSEARFGAATPLVLGSLAVMLALWIVVALVLETPGVRVLVWPRGLEVQSEGAEPALVAWPEVIGARAIEARVEVRLSRDDALVERTLEVFCPSRTLARELATAIEIARTAWSTGPYR